MDIARLDYELPEELIAQAPAEERGASRLMVLHAGSSESPAVGRFAETVVEQLRADDLIVVNDSRVLHARLELQRPTGAACELLLLQPLTGAGHEQRWMALAKPARRLRSGMELQARDGQLVRCVERDSDGTWIVELPVPAREAEGWLSETGQVPLPPYIRANGQPPDRYQTVYARSAGSVAAPTAGLHFGEELWQQLRASHEVVPVTLHVGAGTFLPVRADSLAAHQMHAERYSIADAAHQAIARALDERRRVVAVGTTTTRVLETAYGAERGPLQGQTSLFISPGHSFRCVSALLTNFHLPRSTLLALVMAFAGESTIATAYQHAVRERLRFYSFGDAMFIHGRRVAA